MNSMTPMRLYLYIYNLIIYFFDLVFIPFIVADYIVYFSFYKKITKKKKRKKEKP